MKGYIETYQKCPKCKGKFTLVDEKQGYICTSCHTRPLRYRVVMWQKGKKDAYKIGRDRNGRILDSYERAYRLLTNMRNAIDEGLFDINNFIQKEVEQFYGKNLIPKWYYFKKSQNLSPLHLKEINKCINRFLVPYFNDFDCRNIKSFHIEDFFLTLPTHWHDKTKKNVMTTLHNFCTWLYTREIIERVPVFPEISPPEPVIQWIDRDTQKKILDVIPSHHKPIFTFMIHMPVRTQEARALKVKCINQQDWTVLISEALSGNEIRPRKNKKPYYLPLYSNFDIAVLKDKLPEAFVFTNREGKPYKHRHLVKIWENACKKVGVRIPLKCTRHSAASQAINRGVGLDIVSKACGHSTLEVTKRYASMNVTLLKAVVEY